MLLKCRPHLIRKLIFTLPSSAAVTLFRVNDRYVNFYREHHILKTFQKTWGNWSCNVEVEESPRERNGGNFSESGPRRHGERGGAVKEAVSSLLLQAFLFWLEMWNRKTLSLCSWAAITATIAQRLSAAAWLEVLFSLQIMSRERKKKESQTFIRRMNVTFSNTCQHRLLPYCLLNSWSQMESFT